MKKKILIISFIATMTCSFNAQAGIGNMVDLAKENKKHASIIAVGSIIGAALLGEAVLSSKNDVIIWNLFKSFCTLWSEDSRGYVKEQFAAGNYRLILEVGAFWLFLFGEGLYWSFRGLDKWIEYKADKKVKDSIDKNCVKRELIKEIMKDELENHRDDLRDVENVYEMLNHSSKDLMSRLLFIDVRTGSFEKKSNDFSKKWDAILKDAENNVKSAERHAAELLGAREDDKKNLIAQVRMDLKKNGLLVDPDDSKKKKKKK